MEGEVLRKRRGRGEDTGGWNWETNRRERDVMESTRQRDNRQRRMGRKGDRRRERDEVIAREEKGRETAG